MILRHILCKQNKGKYNVDNYMNSYDATCIYIFWQKKSLFSHEKKTTKTQLIKLCTIDKVHV